MSKQSTSMSYYLDDIKKLIRAGRLKDAETQLHKILVSRDFDKYWGCGALPVMWGAISYVDLMIHPDVPTACIDVVSGRAIISPEFILDHIHSMEDLLFILMHERDHRLLRRLYSVDWSRLHKICKGNEEWINNVRNVIEDAYINASARINVPSTLPETFYADDFGHMARGEYALLTVLSHQVPQDIRTPHQDLYIEAEKLRAKYNVANRQSSNNPLRSGHQKVHKWMMDFPLWVRVFLNWLDQHKNELSKDGDPNCPIHGDQRSPVQERGQQQGRGTGEGSNPSPDGGEGEKSTSDSEGNSPQKGESKDGDTESKEVQDKSEEASEQSSQSKTNSQPQGHTHGSGSQKCSCSKKHQGLLSEPLTLLERLARIPGVTVSFDKLKNNLNNEEIQPKDPNGQDSDEDVEIFGGEKGVSWGGRPQRVPVVAREVQGLEEVDRELLEFGGSAISDAFKTNAFQVKGAIKKHLDDLIQNIATMRVTENKVLRRDFTIPVRPTRHDVMTMALGGEPIMWQHPQYFEQHELVVYLDTSGSMNMWYPIAHYLQLKLKEFGCTVYHFSTLVAKPRPAIDDHVFWTTGGTHFDAVADHILAEGVKAAVVITDNCDNLNQNKAKLLRDMPELYAVFLFGGRRPVSEEKQKAFDHYAKGWQQATDRITRIWEGDIR